MSLDYSQEMYDECTDTYHYLPKEETVCGSSSCSEDNTEMPQASAYAIILTDSISAKDLYKALRDQEMKIVDHATTFRMRPFGKRFQYAVTEQSKMEDGKEKKMTVLCLLSCYPIKPKSIRDFKDICKGEYYYAFDSSTCDPNQMGKKFEKLFCNGTPPYGS